MEKPLGKYGSAYFTNFRGLEKGRRGSEGSGSLLNREKYYVR
jgi:hypothetical protein